MKKILFILVLLSSLSIFAQETVTLEECYNLVSINYPLAKQNEFLKTQNKLDKEVISTKNLPQVSVDAYATYQSDVIEFPTPGMDPLNKDQYRATVSVNQLIYGGGITKAALDVKTTQLKIQEQEIKVNLHQLKLQINQLYFSILLAQEQFLLLKSKETQLLMQLKEIISGIKEGVLLASSDKILEVELLKINQQLRAVESDKTVLIETLSSLIGKSIDNNTNFSASMTEVYENEPLNRPELTLFELKKQEIENSESLLSTNNKVKLQGFAKGGYGNPGLNMLDNTFQPFYILGVTLKWNVFDWNSIKKQQQSMLIHKDIVETEKEIFELNTNIALNKQEKEIQKTSSYIHSDLEIIRLREEVLKIADSQLSNGVITSSAYITELTNLYADKNTLIRHEIQLQLAKANYIIIKGN